MAVKQRGEVSITIGGRKRVLRYNLSALAKLQDHFGFSKISEIGSALQGMGFQDFAHVLFLGLVGDDPTLTEEEVKEWDIGGSDPSVSCITERIGEALSNFLGGGPPETLKK